MQNTTLPTVKRHESTQASFVRGGYTRVVSLKFKDTWITASSDSLTPLIMGRIKIVTPPPSSPTHKLWLLVKQLLMPGSRAGHGIAEKFIATADDEPRALTMAEVYAIGQVVLHSIPSFLTEEWAACRPMLGAAPDLTRYKDALELTVRISDHLRQAGAFNAESYSAYRTYNAGSWA